MFISIIVTLSIPAYSQYKNVKLVEQTTNPRPTITINKKNAENIVAGIVAESFVISNDGGKTWNEKTLKSLSGSGFYPYVVSNSKGSLFYFHVPDILNNSNTGELPYRIACQNYLQEETMFSPGTFIENNSEVAQRNAWPLAHPKKNSVFVSYTQFNKKEKNEPGCQSNIFVSKSMNGNKWSSPSQVNKNSGGCENYDNTMANAPLAIGTDGKMYSAWAHEKKIYFDRSYDDGNTWLDTDLTVFKKPIDWSIEIPGVQSYTSLPLLSIDNSNGLFKGTLYLLWADQSMGKDDTDIWIIRSRNHGDYWSEPVRVNKDEPGKHQFHPWISVDPTNGNVYVVYYDRRNYDNLQTDVYLAYSVDGGNSFDEVKISESPFSPETGKIFNGTCHIDAHDGLIAPIWTQNDNGKTSIWTAHIEAKNLPHRENDGSGPSRKK
ncbi:MAG: exo-alpha-sialidase [Bacteroidetes bacterium]|nr:exo-alpha-sialidase [Bacteroidota bacterium]